jgi:hypothetical protein
VRRNIHSRAIFQQDALHIGLSRVRENVQNSVIFQLVAKPVIADAVGRGLAPERAIRSQNRNAGEPELFCLPVQALRVGEVKRRILCQLMDCDRRAAECLCRDGIVVLFKAGGLGFDKLKGLAKAFLCWLLSAASRSSCTALVSGISS